MILQRLAEHYDRIVAEGKAELALPGKSVQRISFAVVLHPDGTLHSFADERIEEGKQQRARSIVVPGQSKPSGSGINPCFLWDNAEYLLGWCADPVRAERATRAFEASRERHLSLEAQVNDPSFSAVCTFLRTWTPEQAEPHAARLSEIATNFGVFRIVGERKYVHETVEITAANRVSDAQEIAGHCLVTGRFEPVARLHEPKIKGVSGAQSSGALLVSFNASAFESYGRSQSYNAPVSQGVTFRYTNALNSLLSDREKRISLGDTTVVYWADHPTPLEGALGGIFSSPPEDPPEEDFIRVQQAKRLLMQLRDGIRNTVLDEPERPTKFFILGLSPNASRLSVRLWIEQDASELRQNLAEHVQDLALGGGRDGRMLAVWQIVQATGRAERDKATGRVKSYDTKATSPQLAGELARSILTGAPYPQALLATVIRRIRSDGDVAWARVSAIKSVLVRNARKQKEAPDMHAAPVWTKTSEIVMELNEQNSSLAYRCGRIFAVLERAQEQSVTQDNPNARLNATIKDRFFGAAAAAPLLVLPRLLVLNNHHTRKLREGSKRYLTGLLGAIMESKPFAFPRQLTLEQQGEFIVGYFQQRQDFYKAKEQPDKEFVPEEAETAA
ncbi:type I-C CRISPR-associated protein Cas8c/Csd1 [Terriglobus sp.]|uniref:type I-C CRISPR-associated protein Cas8c/Csd1 n=1 Tax=Terriglobus sp. TaxID=1889013 RepID=UPI003B002DEE